MYIVIAISTLTLISQYFIYRKLGQIMATVAQFQAALAAVDAETTRIAAKIDALIAELNADALDSAQEEAAFAGLQAAADRLRLVGVDVANPVPPVEEPPVEPSPEPPIV